MSHPYTICGIDIGNTAIKAVIARVEPGATQPEVVGVGSVASTSALRAGEVVDMKEATDATRLAIQHASAMAGVPVRRAYLAVNGLHIGTQVSKGTIAVGRADGEITAGDIERVISTAQVVSLPPNREIIHVIPREFIIDGTEHVRDPLGMKGVRLEADVLIVHGLSRHLKNIAKCANECGVEVAGYVFAPLAASMSVLDKHQKEFGVAHLDFGGGTASLTVWDQADMVHSAIMRVGSRHITNDLAILLKTSLETAEQIKLQLGIVNERWDRRKKPELVDLSAYMEEPFTVQRRDLMGAIEARTRELLDMVQDELKKAGKDGLLPAGIVVSGGGSKLPGFAALVRDTLSLPVRIAKPVGVEAFDAAMDPSFAVAVGLVAWGFAREVGEGYRPTESSAVGGWVKEAVAWLKNFLP
ncbi:MAG: cell division protein FtsA [Candidatus Yanofskybacteria bacterium]|nr:cell division protein FtsA [Candidatus Yanofskybacteria bacterium]